MTKCFNKFKKPCFWPHFTSFGGKKIFSLKIQHNFQTSKNKIKSSGSKEHLDWLKTDLNVAEIITVQDCKTHTKILI